MALDLDLWQALRQQMISATINIVPRPQVVIDWPSQTRFSELTQNGGSMIVIFDPPNMARPSTRWVKLRGPVQITPCFTATSISQAFLPAGALGVITLNANASLDTLPGAPNPGDAVSCSIAYGTTQRGVIAVAIGGDTYSSLAARLAAAINAGSDPNFVGHLSAIPVANMVQVKNIGSVPLNWNSQAGNNGSQIIELARENRPVLISCFSSSFDYRQAVAAAVKEQCATLQRNFGVQFPDGSAARVLLNNNMYFRDYHSNDLWRFDQYLDCDQGITTLDTLYSVLVFQWDKTPS